MPKFVRLVIDRKKSHFENTEYLSQVMFLYLRYSKFLKDDYAPEDTYENIVDFIEKSGLFFWVILSENDEFAGFVYLDNLIGNEISLHSAELTTCFEKKFWGDFTKKAAKEFLRYCFQTIGFVKIKALVYPFNLRTRNLLKHAGFEKECVLKCETLKNKRLQDVAVYVVWHPSSGAMRRLLPQLEKE